MARGPFSANPNSAPDVAPIQLQGGFSPTPEGPNVLDAVVQLGQVASEVYIDQGKKAATADIKQQLSSVRDALQVTNNPNLDQSAFAEEARKNPYFNEQLKEFKGLAAAQRSGKLSSDYVVQRLETIVATATARTPAFEAELKAAARDAIGFDPQHRMMALLMSQSDEDVRLSKLEQEAQSYGITVPELININREQLQLGLQKQRLEVDAAEGKYNTNSLAKDARITSAGISVQVMTTAQQQIAAGGVVDPVTMAANARAMFAGERAALSARAGSVDATILNGHLASLDKLEQQTLEQIENGTMANMLTQNKELLTLTAQNAMLETPVLGRIYAVMGPDVAPRIMADVLKWAKNPSAAKAWAASGEGAEIDLALKLSGIDDGLSIIIGDRGPQNDHERRVVAELMGPVLQSPQVKGQQLAEGMTKIEEMVGPQYNIINMGNPAVASNIGKNKEAHSIAINTLSSQQASLITEFAMLQSEGKDYADRTRMVDGRLEYVYDRREIGGVQPQRLEHIVWMKNMNRLFKAYDNMKKVGVVTDSQYQSPKQMWEKITGAEGQPEGSVAEDTGVETWDFDAEGNLVRTSG